MSDDEVDPELLNLLRQRLGIQPRQSGITSETHVLRDAEYIYSNAIDVAIDRHATVSAAQAIWAEMQNRSYSRSAWAEHELHPKAKDQDTLNFIFIMDLLNFSFWSSLSEDRRWSVFYRGRRWTGYWSLVACLQRALDEGIPITTPSFWIPATGKPEEPEQPHPQHESTVVDPSTSSTEAADRNADGAHAPAVAPIDRIPQEKPLAQIADVADGVAHLDIDEAEDVTHNSMTDVEADIVEPAEPVKSTEPIKAPVPARSHLTAQIMTHVFRGDGDEIMPMLAERLGVLYEAGEVLHKHFDGSVAKLVEKADNSAGKLVNLLAHYFDCFRDESKFDRKKVRFLKRAQIFVADVWAAFDAQGFGRFDDIGVITMFADYRIPQQLHSLGCFSFSPTLNYTIKKQKLLEPGSSWECQLRGCSIWVVELIRRQILADHPGAEINAVLIDFFLYDLAKEREKAGEQSIPHHRTRSMWY